MSDLYRRLAFTNMKNNRQFYLPYLLTSIMSVMLFYVMYALAQNDVFKTIRGADSVIMVLKLGVFVIAFFVIILIFYTNSFIMKRRKKELGVYNILGMEKIHVARVLFWETASVYVMAAAGGLIAGIVFSKFFSLLLCKIMGAGISIPFTVSLTGVALTAVLFAGIYLANLLYNFLQVKLANPVELLSSGHAGEKEPKTQVFKAVYGVVCIVIAYAIAITTENPASSIGLFFVAVILVIAGTYALFTAGSIAVLKLLRKNKGYYYKTNHFISVSGMMYRMKQNAVGLGNICILSTMVLVMLSVTVGLYAGINETTKDQCPDDVMLKLTVGEAPNQEFSSEFKDKTIKFLESESGHAVLKTETTGVQIVVYLNGGEFSNHYPENFANLLESVYVFEFRTKSDFEMNNPVTVCDIEKGQAVILSNKDVDMSNLNFFDLKFEIKDTVNTSDMKDVMDINSEMEEFVGGHWTVVVADDEELFKVSQAHKTALNGKESNLSDDVNYEVGFDIGGNLEEKIEIYNKFRDQLEQWGSNGEIAGQQFKLIETNCQAIYYQENLTVNGAMLFLGLFLGLMFLLVTVLIIYFKQISEGYEDRERFAILQKVGMGDEEVRGTIRTQVRIVFFLPLITAVLHLMAATPLLNRILLLMNLFDVKIFILSAAGTVLVYAVIYYAVFKLTSKSYYKIVGNQV